MTIQHKEDCAYAAGIIDGEGHIRIAQPPSRPYGVLIVRVGMSDKIVPQWLQDYFGGFLGHYKSDKSRKSRNIWMLEGIRAFDFLKIIQPYIKLKEKHIDIGLRFGETIGIKGQSVSQKTILLRNELRAIMMALNQI